ncbi:MULTISPECIES: hypothetical protein [Corynebacterium]|uniref:hypothetical protein n=1 Tax=Corynebacterium TaxID=1716 RepID=UPI00054FF6F8|nr:MULTISPECIES: hypothetical protein [Corynebacterium]MBC6794993.1 hypothetical protein [Corynebacterium sp. LK28]MDK8870924.1 hypothetical protein [Corynebacterium macclintockiae]
MTTTVPPSTGTTITPPNRTVHYILSSAGTAVGTLFLLLAVLGIFGVPGLRTVIPWPLVISLFFLIPGIAGLWRGPGQPSTYEIPRPKQRKFTDKNRAAKTSSSN